jgi:hypothetical protein
LTGRIRGVEGENKRGGAGWLISLIPPSGPNGTRLLACSHFTGPKKLRNSRAQPPLIWIRIRHYCMYPDLDLMRIFA